MEITSYGSCIGWLGNGRPCVRAGDVRSGSGIRHRNNDSASYTFGIACVRGGVARAMKYPRNDFDSNCGGHDLPNPDAVRSSIRDVIRGYRPIELDPAGRNSWRQPDLDKNKYQERRPKVV